MKKLNCVLTIAGSDSCGGAGIQADIKTIFSLGLYASSAITAITAQNTTGVKNIMGCDAKVLYDQIDVVLKDIDIKAIKIGMLYSKENVEVVRRCLDSNNYRGFIVLDPVLVATSGDKLAKNDLLTAMEEKLFPISTIITPNIPEAVSIGKMNIYEERDMQECGEKIMKEYNVKNVLIKGGHLTGDTMTDILISEGGKIKKFSNKSIISSNTHGTGCTLSSAIACFLVKGMNLEKSVKRAKKYITYAVDGAKNVRLGLGAGPVNHFYAGKKMLNDEDEILLGSLIAPLVSMD